MNATVKVSASSDLCFDENEFLDTNFNVDQFVAKCKDRYPLITLREDLEKHYKNIQLALVDLINQDYSDFVSLSSNLIGTEKTIENLKVPLTQIQSQILVVKDGMSSVLHNLEMRLEKRKKISEKKSCVHHLMNLVHSVEKIEKVLAADPTSPGVEIIFDEDRTEPGHYLERIAGEFNQLQFHVNQTKGHPIIESIRPRVALITSKLQETLEETFQQGITSRQSDLVHRCLRTYALIDKISHAEELLRRILVKPFVGDIVNEVFYEQNGIDAILSELLNFITQHCDIVLHLTSGQQYTSHDHNVQSVKGFDFLVNSIWIEIEQAFEERLPLIFSPGNPDRFLKRYRSMMHFMEDLETHCINYESVNSLRSHPTYHSFMIKWSLPVYFQIRFQEIACQVEIATENPFDKSSAALYVSDVVGKCWLSITRCWHDDIYVSSLKGRFWKLTLQIISRLASFVKENSGKEATDISTSHICTLLSDGYYFVSNISNYFKDVIWLKLSEEGGPQDHHTFNDALNEATGLLVSQLDSLNQTLVTRLSTEGCTQFDNVRNVPRLFRRTNRDTPSQPSGYVATAMKCLTEFNSDASSLGGELKSNVLKEALGNISSRYCVVVEELLTSIRKTEDSLLRLKQQRKSMVNSADSTQTAKANDVTDEYKIRKQVLLDAREFGKQITTFGLSLDAFPDYERLILMAESSLNP